MKNFFSFRNLSHSQISLLRDMIILLIIISILALSVGSYKILSFFDFIKGNLNQADEFIFKELRIPRVFLAGFVGASLALSGACLQGLFRNPLADPGLIGVSSGAALGASCAIVLGGSTFVGMYLVPFSAILGSVLIIFLLFVITKNFSYSGITYILLAGIAINSLAGVGIGFLTYISDEAALRGLTFWTMGSFEGATGSLTKPAIIIIIITMIWIMRFSRKLDLIQLGELEAYRLGVDVKRLKWSVIISSSIIVGISVSLVGMIGFVGLVVPHLIRLIGGVNHNFLLLGSIFLGAALMILSDLIARIIIAPALLPVGLITSAIGSPFFLWLIFKMRKG